MVKEDTIGHVSFDLHYTISLLKAGITSKNKTLLHLKRGSKKYTALQRETNGNPLYDFYTSARPKRIVTTNFYSFQFVSISFSFDLIIN